MQQSVDAAQVDENPVFGDVLDDTVDEVSLFQFLQCFRAALFALFLKQDPSGQNNVAAFLVHFYDTHLEFFADQLFQITNGPQIYLRTREEGFEPNVNRQPAFRLGDYGALDNFIGFICFNQFVP